MTPAQEQAFDDNLKVIDIQLCKRRSLWSLTSLAWMDFEDVSQIIRIHIYKKWELYDPTKPLIPWVNKIISHQIKNLIRNNFSNYAKPCLRCSASLPDNGCEVYGVQCGDCPILKHWLNRKENAYNIKIPVSLENHDNEIVSNNNTSANLPEHIIKFQAVMKKQLKPVEWRVYEALYIHNKTELEIAKEMGFKTSEKNRSPGYKQIKNIQKAILKRAKKILKDDESDVF